MVRRLERPSCGPPSRWGRLSHARTWKVTCRAPSRSSLASSNSVSRSVNSGAVVVAGREPASFSGTGASSVPSMLTSSSAVAMPMSSLTEYRTGSRSLGGSFTTEGAGRRMLTFGGRSGWTLMARVSGSPRMSCSSTSSSRHCPLGVPASSVWRKERICPASSMRRASADWPLMVSSARATGLFSLRWTVATVPAAASMTPLREGDGETSSRSMYAGNS